MPWYAWLLAIVAAVGPAALMFWARSSVSHEKAAGVYRPILSIEQRRHWAAAAQVVWMSPSVSFLVLLGIGLPLDRSAFWAIVVFATAANAYVVGGKIAGRRSNTRGDYLE